MEDYSIVFPKQLSGYFVTFSAQVIRDLALQAKEIVASYYHVSTVFSF